MYYNNADVETQTNLEEYQPKPTWGETLNASFKNFTSVNLSTSEQDYYYEDLKPELSDWAKRSPENKDIFKRVAIMSPDAIEQYEDLYNKGKIETIAADKSEIGGLTGGQAYLKFKELEKAYGLKNLKSIKDASESRAKSDYLTSLDALSKSEYTSAKMLGTMGGVMTDPITLATLPLGTFIAGPKIGLNALRAFGQEALIETGAQGIIAPKVYSFKKELELKTSIIEESITALSSIATAGAFRAAGSATYDLTAKGIAQLKVKDPELARDYTNLAKDNAVQDLDGHVQNMHKTEFGSGIDEIQNPNKKGQELNEMPSEREVEAMEFKDIKDEDLQLTMGTDEKGSPIQKSYKELETEIDTESTQMEDLFKCLRRVQ